MRAVSSRALGAMVKGMGESSFDDLLPWLMQTLTSESSSVDRSGAAQGLAEVRSFLLRFLQNIVGITDIADGHRNEMVRMVCLLYIC